MLKVAKTPPVHDKSIKMEDDYLKSRRALAVLVSSVLSSGRQSDYCLTAAPVAGTVSTEG